MKYNIAITKGNNINIIDLNLTDIKKLDEFTSEFNNEMELKEYFFQKDKINTSDLTKKVEIVHTWNKKIFRSPVIYKGAKKYLNDNLEYCINELVNKDVEFLKEYIKLLQNDKSVIYKNMDQSLSDLIVFLDDYYNDNIYNDSYIMRNEALKDIYKKYTYSKSNKLNYNNLRKLAILIDKYISKRTMRNSDIIQGEQLLMFSNEEDDNYVEPMFPPNSYEEEMYNKYLDSLNVEMNKEDHDHYKRM